MTDYDKLKVADLKDLVKERGIVSTGLKLKQQFIDALEAQDANGATKGDAQVREGDGEEVLVAELAAEVAVAADGEAGGAAETEAAGEQQDEDVVNASATEQKMEDASEEFVGSNSDIEIPNKRKRRSATPSLSEGTVSKKLKTADEEPVKLPEDVAVEAQAPTPMDENEDTEAAEKVLGYGGSDDVVEMKDARGDSSDAPKTTTDEAGDVDMAESGRPASNAREEQENVQVNPSSPTSKHPITRALYISNLVRPLQPGLLREHLLAAALPEDASSDEALIEAFHLDKLRTHALVLFSTKAAAVRVRAALHDTVWPDEPQRKALWVDYIPNAKVQEWIDTEINREDRNVRWEVVYESSGLDTDSAVIATLQDSAASSSAARNSSSSGGRQPPVRTGEGMPNAPSGPRRPSRQSEQPPPTPQHERAAQSKSFDSLDANYKFTESKPKIYYQPVSRELADSRLEELSAGTSRDWDDRQADPSLYDEGQLRRYTFEDGDRLVDGGADFGLFGRRPARGGFRGRGRGDRGGPRTDSYRGGGARR